jgi:hypothetical protein
MIALNPSVHHTVTPMSANHPQGRSDVQAMLLGTPGIFSM